MPRCGRRPTASQRPHAFQGRPMDCPQAVALCLSGACASSLVHPLRAVSPGLPPRRHAVRLRSTPCPGHAGVFEGGRDGLV